MKYLAFIVLLFSTLLSISIYATKNYKYRDFVIETKSEEVKTYNVNVNLADEYEFSNLHGVGDELAKRIVADREENGRFNYVEDLMRVKGIGKKKFENFRKYLTMEVTI